MGEQPEHAAPTCKACRRPRGRSCASCTPRPSLLPLLRGSLALTSELGSGGDAMEPWSWIWNATSRLPCLPTVHVPSVTYWLKRYPTITVVARDRSKEF